MKKIFDNKAKGWLFFFAEINNENLLHTLDHYIGNLIKRFDVNIAPKKFVRSFKELSHRKHEITYIPNFDKYTLEQKKINKPVKDLLVDVQNFAY